MLETISDLKKMPKEQYKELMDGLRAAMAKLEQDVMKAKIPVMVVFEGWSAAGKGSAISNLLYSMDPRGFKLYNIGNQAGKGEDCLYSFLAKYGTKLPKYGEMAIFDRSWYREMLAVLAKKRPDYGRAEKLAKTIAAFERQFVDDGGVIVKIFLHISKEEQEKRLYKLADDEETNWRATEHDFLQNKKYERFYEAFDSILMRTDFTYAGWTLIAAKDRRATTVGVYRAVLDAVGQRLQKEADQCGDFYTGGFQLIPIESVRYIDKTAAVPEEEYKKKQKILRDRISELHNVIYKRRIPVIVCYEGWDAAGKGGNIKRLTRGMDPRGYDVHPISAPDAEERAHHYLWRFMRRLPKAGHIAVFDRTWYGRLMVERIEGFCPEYRWKRAFGEINEFERCLTEWGAVVLKFFVNIDSDEQLKRFEARRDTPEKQWKLTEEDWRNREKWGAYEEAIDDMMKNTNTAFAPWHIIQSMDKKYARIQAMELFVRAVEEKLVSAPK